MKNKQYYGIESFTDNCEIVQIRKQELRHLYLKVQEYEQLIALYQKEKQDYIHLLIEHKITIE